MFSFNDEKAWQFHPSDARYSRDAPKRADRLERKRAEASVRRRGQKEIRDVIAVQLIALRVASINRARQNAKLAHPGPTP